MIKCKYCNNEMRLDDVDFNFKGNKDNYYVCDNCKATSCEKIRYGKSVSVEFQEPEDDVHCYECGGYGDDYSYDEETDELVSNCDNCPYNGDDGEDN